MRKPKQWDTHNPPLGRPGYWLALLIALFAWAVASGYATDRVVLLSFGAILAAVVQLVEDQRFAVERRIREALRQADLTITAASICYYGKDGRASDFEKALRGERPLDIAKLEILLGTEFSRCYAALTLIEKGPPTFYRQMLKMVFAPEGGAV